MVHLQELKAEGSDNQGHLLHNEVRGQPSPGPETLIQQTDKTSTCHHMQSGPHTSVKQENPKEVPVLDPAVQPVGWGCLQVRFLQGQAFAL